MSSYKEQIDNMVWSHSRLTSFEHCKYEFYLQYILADDEQYLSEGNFYAEAGGFVHEILAMIFNGELNIEDASKYYVDNFEKCVCYKVKESTMAKTFENCADYFANVDFTWLNNYDILGVEDKVEFEIKGYKFIGFIDLLLRDKRDGKIVIVDHKSSIYPFRRDGKVKARVKDNFEKYKHQMYLYCYGVQKRYGEFPKKITWNHFKDGGEFASIPFVEKEYEKAIKWAINTIKKIESEESYSPVIEELRGTNELSKEYYYCNFLCSFRHSCEYNKNLDWSNI